MSVEYTPAPQAANIARKLIHDHHLHLGGITIEYVFRSEHADRHGHAVWGKARKVSGLNAYLVGTYRAATGEYNGASDEPFFVIELAADIWAVLSAKEREALVDHELHHCKTKITKDGELSLYVAPHDLEEFNEVVSRHGLWRKSVDGFLKALKAGQPTLFSELVESGDGEHQEVVDSEQAPVPVP